MGSFRFSRRVAIGILAGATVIGLSVTAGSAAAAPQARIPLNGSTPRWLHQAQDLGTSSTSGQVSFGVLLGMRDQAGAEATLKAISDPASASYGQWLSNAAFDARYAPARASVTAVQSWLKSQGFQVTTTLPSGMLVEASGSVAKVQSVFGTTLHNYSYLGKTVRANATQLSLPSGTPAAVSGAVSGVVGIDQGSALKQIADTEPGPPGGQRYGVQPCSTYYAQKIATAQPPAYGKSQPYAVCGYVPQQLQAAYGEANLFSQGITGKGVTVAITDAYASPTIYQDAQLYSSRHNQPLFLPGNQFTQITPGPDGYDNTDLCDAQGWYGEETLDVEAVHTMAPGAKIVYVGASDCLSGLDDAWASAIDNHIADVITNSWTDGTDDINLLGTAYVQFYVQFSMEAALTGITVNFSSGDSGDHTAGGTDLAAKTVEFPADLPYVTGVGGTSLFVGTQGWVGEYGWQNAYSSLTNGAWSPTPPGTYSSGGGGGTSQLFTQPFYQAGKVPANISEYYGSTPMRAVPDIAMDADPNTGMEVGQTQVFPDGTYWDQYRIGGTSLASPLLAGVVAMADQAHRAPLGFINPLYYSLLGTSSLHDIVAPKSPLAQVRTDYTNFLDNSEGVFFRLQTIDVQSSTLHDTPGYDDETGVGTPVGPTLLLSGL